MQYTTCYCFGVIALKIPATPYRAKAIKAITTAGIYTVPVIPIKIAHIAHKKTVRTFKTKPTLSLNAIANPFL